MNNFTIVKNCIQSCNFEEITKILKNQQINLLEKEIYFETSRSSGPGGQNVNKTESKVTLFWKVSDSEAINESEKLVIIEKNSNKINEKGELILYCQESRSQLQNKTLVFKKLIDLIEKSLEKAKPRLATKIPKAVKIKIVNDKKLLGQKKENRKRVVDY